MIETFIHEMGVHASALTLKGDAGIGKTTLWKLAVGAVEARGHVVFRCRGSQTEGYLSFAALGDLLVSTQTEMTSAQTATITSA